MSQPAAANPLASMMTGYWVSQAIYVAAKLALPDLLKNGPQTAEQLAASTKTQPAALYRLLRGLASVGLLREDEHRRFAITPTAEPLASDAPNSQRSLAIMMGEEHFACWGELLYSIRTGQSAFEKIFGEPIFNYLSKRPPQAQIFDEAMVGVHGRETGAMLDAYDLSAIGTLADVGGGNGSLLRGALEKYPTMRGMLCDLPGVVDRARPLIAAAGLADRVQTIPTDFFAAIPAGADAYLMRHIIHDWNDEQSLKILRNVRRTIGPAGRLLLVESVIPPGNDPSFAKLLDLNMLVIPGGKERTETEYRELYLTAGFRLSGITPTWADVSVIEGRPV
ncbi:MAG: methyltransferase [Planctomycetia bacterium]|nr:methyltransferase [Planctomycetia bacterium]